LGFRDRIRNSLQKDEKRGKPGTWHSTAYHRFFEGYSEVAVPRINGKGTIIQRIYTGNYYRQDLTNRQRILVRILYALMFLGIVYLFVSSATLPLSSNTTWYVVISQVVSVPFLFWIFIIFLSYLPAGRDLTIDGYRSSSLALKKATMSAAVSLGVVSLAMLVFVILNMSNMLLDELLLIIKYLVGGLLALTMNRIECKLKYLMIPSQNSAPVDAMEVN
jgi:hypothetical protein